MTKLLIKGTCDMNYYTQSTIAVISGQAELKTDVTTDTIYLTGRFTLYLTGRLTACRHDKKLQS